jgi:rubrerythrin
MSVDYTIKGAVQREYDLDNSDDKAMYDEMLDECSASCPVCKQFGPARILEEMDPIAYRCGFNDYVDGLPERWECPECGAVYEDEESAKWCHQAKPDDDE